jgi:hypothetical protein
MYYFSIISIIVSCVYVRYYYYYVLDSMSATRETLAGGAGKGGDIIVNSIYYHISPLPRLTQACPWEEVKKETVQYCPLVRRETVIHFDIIKQKRFTLITNLLNNSYLFISSFPLSLQFNFYYQKKNIFQITFSLTVQNL